MPPFGRTSLRPRAQSHCKIAADHASELRQGIIIRQINGDRDEPLSFNRRYKQNLDVLGILHTYRQWLNTPHELNFLLDALGEDNWAFYCFALGERNVNK